MMRKKGWFISLMLLGASCLDEPDCFRLDNNIIGITYRVIGSGSTNTLSFDGLTTDAADSIFHQHFSGTTFPLPLDLADDEITYEFQGLDKTLKLGYTVRPQFVSENCGPRLVFSDLHLLEHDFDSARVVQPTPGLNNQAKNIELFRCPVIGSTIIGFYQLYSRAKAADQVAILVEGITTNFTGTTVYFGNMSRRDVTLPINTDASSTAFIFNLGNGPQELVLDYDTVTETRYRPCGVQTFVSGLTIKSHMFDSIAIPRDARGVVQNALSDPAQMNVRIYRCPITNLAQLAFRRPADGGEGTVADEVEVTGIRADYTSELFYPDQTVSVVTLPLNPEANTTTFFIDYLDRTETLTLNYTRSEVSIFPQCQQNVFHNVFEAVDLENVTPKADSLTFPPVTNFEILNQ